MIAQEAPSVRLEVKESLAVKPIDAGVHPIAVRKAIAMNNETVVAANSFHSLFCQRHNDGKEPSEHSEQDLLRAMLLFSCSGLDAVVKQLVRDSLEIVIAQDLGAQAQFSKFIERRLKRAGDDSERSQSNQLSIDFGLLSSALASPEPRKVLINNLINSLTSDSLQSKDQLLKVGGQFALTSGDILASANEAKDAFDARNQIAHEMDIDFREENRRIREYGQMVKWSESVLTIAENFISKISSKIPS